MLKYKAKLRGRKGKHSAISISYGILRKQPSAFELMQARTEVSCKHSAISISVCHREANSYQMHEDIQEITKVS
ncbi:MAG: hypothetical protein SWX82_20235 [Cyanobacteriota bacterium]|nr:hypothetical protein [Cyanobacteriota bacterium]